MTKLEKAELGGIARHYNLPLEAIKPEMFDFLVVVAAGAKKYAMDNWLDSNGIKTSNREMSDSIFHHVAQAFTGEFIDPDDGIDVDLKIACRALMRYTRRQRGILHSEDKINTVNKMSHDNQQVFKLEYNHDDSNCLTMEEFEARVQSGHFPYYMKDKDEDKE